MWMVESRLEASFQAKGDFRSDFDPAVMAADVRAASISSPAPARQAAGGRGPRSVPLLLLAPANVADLVEGLGLDGKLHTYYRLLSGGQKQRLSIALALIGSPRLASRQGLDSGSSDLAAVRDATMVALFYMRYISWSILCAAGRSNGAGPLVGHRQSTS
jgi:hypothetical protein